MRLNDLTGKKLGRSTVLFQIQSAISPSGKKRTKWRCQCDCGNVFDTLGDSIKRNYNIVCEECTNKDRSKNNRIDVIGNKYGRLTIIGIVPNTKPTKVICQCDCGNEHICAQADVVSGHTQSCGCLQSERAGESNVKDWTGHVSESGVEFLKQDHMNSKGQWVWECKCGVCGNIFYELPARINNGHVTSCGCRTESFWESFINDVLYRMDVTYVTQYTFDDCRDKYKLRFDFAIFSCDKLIGLIEYDGKQHFEPIDFFGGLDGFVATVKRDRIKDAYCKTHNIPLLRLPYTLSMTQIQNKIYEYYESLTTAGCA